MCGSPEEEIWMCDECYKSTKENPQGRLCKKCYEYGKANADMLIRDTWAWGDDLELYANDIKKRFLEELEEIKPLGD